MRKAVHLLFLLILLAGLLVPSGNGSAAILKQYDAAYYQASSMMRQMSPEERIGQLFLVSFEGAKISPDSQIVGLIAQKHIGGVVLRADNNNFVGPDNTAVTAQNLIESLQTTGWESHQKSSNDQSTAGYVPLLIGINQEGDLYPYSQIFSGITEIPDQMAVGATWNPEYSRTVGSILGSELSALGFNLLFGPSLDVLDSVQTSSGEDLGVRTFGGDPFWVGEMGKAYIKGVHQGSDGKIAVIATHFPGRGGSDRQPEKEVATVRKSLEQLKQVELAPFFSVTGNADENDQIADGLLLSHIRYQGFQGNIRATTKPVSFDAAALELIMDLPQFNGWRKRGGIIVSDDLGSEAVRKFFDPLNTGFDARQVARSALLAGNDLLYLGNITSTNDPDSYTTIVRTIDYFTQRYREDSAFQKRVDQAVMQILTMKFRIYPEFQLDAALANQIDLMSLGQSNEKILDIAEHSATLVSPDTADIASVLPNPPQFNDRIVFISDLVTYKQCSSCGDQTSFPAEKLMDAVVRLYGPGSGDQIQASRMHAYSFEKLRILLEHGTDIEAVQSDMGAADWIVFAFSDADEIQYEKTIFQRLFTERPDLTRDKKIIGMAFNAPYYFDATDVSKFTAYYAFYSRISVFFDIAARVLFQELTPTGDLPVSVPGIGYDLITATSPDPNQIIPLNIESPGEGQILGTPPTGYSKPLQYKAGDTIPIQAGIIIDMNGNPVPDGTVVRFLIDSRSANGTLEQLEMQTKDGIARVTYTIPSIGSLELRVEADPAFTSQILRLDITTAGGVVTAYEPTVSQEETSVTEPSVEPTPTAVSFNKAQHEQGKLSILDWFLSTLLVVAVCFVFNRIAHKLMSMKWNAWITLGIAACGNLAYVYAAVGLPGAASAVQNAGTGFVLLIVILGMVTGLVLGFALYWLTQKRKQPTAKQ